MCSPSQVLGDVYTEVLEAAHPLHRGPTDHKRSVGPLLTLAEVHKQLFSFAHIQVKSSHLYLYSAFNNTNCDKATAQYQNGKIVSIM